MKIAYVFGSLNPGGSERQTANIAVRLMQRGHEVTAVLANGAGNIPGNLYPYLKQAGLPMVDLSGEKQKIPAMAAVFDKLKPDVVNSNGYPMTINGSLAAYQAGVPLRIIRYENTGFVRQEFPQDWKFEMAGHAATQYIVANSAAVYQTLGQYHGSRCCQWRTIYNGVTVPDSKSVKSARSLSRQHWALNGEVTVGHLANFRLDGLKNQLMLVRAAHRVLKEEPGVSFLMVGYETQYADTVRSEIRRLGISDRVRTPGRIDDVSLIAGWDIGVNTSHTEGLCNAVQECMAYAMPIVATAVGGNPELVQHGKTGYLVDDDDDAALADRLLQLIRTPRARVAMGKAGRAHIQQIADWDTVLDQWLDLYHEGLEAAHA
jgi:glycosyltransferase involved in cell wall biosynthesis